MTKNTEEYTSPTVASDWKTKSQIKNRQKENKHVQARLEASSNNSKKLLS
jgi:hypothetical protein